MSTPLFTKPIRSRLSPTKKTTQREPSTWKGSNRDVMAAYKKFQASRITSLRVTRA